MYDGRKYGSEGWYITIDKLKKNDPAVDDLIFWNCDLNNEAIRQLIEAIPQNDKLRSIDLRANPRLTSSDICGLLKGIKDKPNITALQLFERERGFSVDEFNAILDVLKENRTISKLNLFDGKLDRHNITQLFTLLETNHSLSSLKLEYAPVDDSIAKSMALSLKKNTTLISLQYNRARGVEQTTVDEITDLIGQNAARYNELILRIEQNDIETVNSLVKKGVNLVALVETSPKSEKVGQSPLHLAIYYKHIEIAKILIQALKQYEISLNLLNKKGQTPADLAKGQGSTELLELFVPTEPSPSALAESFATLQVGFEIPYTDLTLGKKLGNGGYGAVYLAKWRYNNVAVKQLHVERPAQDALAEFQQEVAIMQHLRAPNLVQFYGACSTQAPYCIVMEYLSQGSLYDYLKQSPTVPLSEARQEAFALDITQGLTFLHASSIYHRDLKSLNVLLDENYRAKLADFGLSKIKQETKTTSTLSTSKVGTVAWMAPELFARHAVFTDKADMYSYGMVLWEIASRKTPFQDAHDPSVIPSWVKEGEREEIPVHTPPKLAKLITWCWAVKPQDRPTAQAALAHLQSQETVFVADPSAHPAPAFRDELFSGGYRRS